MTLVHTLLLITFLRLAVTAVHIEPEASGPFLLCECPHCPIQIREGSLPAVFRLDEHTLNPPVPAVVPVAPLLCHQQASGNLATFCTDNVIRPFCRVRQSGSDTVKDFIPVQDCTFRFKCL